MDRVHTLRERLDLRRDLDLERLGQVHAGRDRAGQARVGRPRRRRARLRTSVPHTKLQLHLRALPRNLKREFAMLGWDLSYGESMSTLKYKYLTKSILEIAYTRFKLRPLLLKFVCREGVRKKCRSGEREMEKIWQKGMKRTEPPSLTSGL